MSSAVGRAGEFLAAFVLETYGVEVHHVDRAGADLWCKVRGSIIPMEVKAASKPRHQTGSSVFRYEFLTRSAGPEWYCFVALDLKLVLLYPRSSVQRHTTRIYPHLFTEEEQRRTVDTFLNSC